MAVLLFSPLPLLAPAFCRNPQHVPSLVPFRSLRKVSIFDFPQTPRTLTISFALAESDSPKSLDDQDELLPLLRDLAESLDLPPDYLAQLPNDLRLDLNDAAFDLSNGPVMDECGQELGEMLLSLSLAWEKADTSTSSSIARQITSLGSSLKEDVKYAFGRRLVSAGRRFQSMGQYGQGELQKIADVMIKTGNLLSKSQAIKTSEKPKETRMLKFGDLQVELTSEKAKIGAAIAAVFGFLSWELSQGIQGMPESSLQYANDNALQLAKSLRGTLLVIGYSSTVLSAVASVGLLLLARQLSSESK